MTVMATTVLPTKNLTNLEQFYLSSFWFSTSLLWGAILFVLVQSQVSVLVPETLKGTGVGLVVGIGSLAGILVPPFMGAWSDRVRSRLGRRRPFMLIGTAVTLVALVGLAYFPFMATGPLWGFTVA